MFKVIVRFVDLKDDNHVYQVGDVFPHDGRRVSDARINELKGTENKRHRALIAEVVEKRVSEPIPAPIMNPPEEIPMEVEKHAEEAPKKKRTYTRKKK